jgi:hypothetical protein
MYPSVDAGDTGSSGTQQIMSSAAVMNPWLTMFYWWSYVTLEGSNLIPP